MGEAEYGVKFQTGVPNVLGSGGQFGWANDQYVPPMPLSGKLVGQINGVAASAFINCVNCASEYDSMEGRLAGDFGIIEVIDDEVSWARASIPPVMPAAKRAAITSDFFGEVFI